MNNVDCAGSNPASGAIQKWETIMFTVRGLVIAVGFFVALFIVAILNLILRDFFGEDIWSAIALSLTFLLIWNVGSKIWTKK